MNISKFLWGITYILLGILWFATSFGYLDGSVVWTRALSLWPLLIILAGLNLIIRNRTSMAAVGLVVILASFAYVVYSPVSLSEVVGNKSDQVQSTQTNLDPAEKSLDITVSTGAVALDIRAMTEEESATNDVFAEGRNLGGSIAVEKTVKDGVAKLNISEIEDNTGNEIPLVIGNSKNVSNRSVKILISRKVPFTITLNSGASNEKLDFSQLMMEKLSVKSGAVNSEIRLGSVAGTHNLNIESGASSYKLLFPKNVGYKVVTNGGLTNVHLPNGSELVNGEAEKKSENYDSVASKYDVTVRSGLANLTVTTY